jgi:hypothetical protein
MDMMPKTDVTDTGYPKDYDPGLIGLGGWLVLVIIGRFLTIVSGFKDVLDSKNALGSSYESDTLLYINVAVDVCMIILSVCISILYFQKGYRFP